MSEWDGFMIAMIWRYHGNSSIVGVGFLSVNCIAGGEEAFRIRTSSYAAYVSKWLCRVWPWLGNVYVMDNINGPRHS
jgi:hypothetical protein